MTFMTCLRGCLPVVKERLMMHLQNLKCPAALQPPSSFHEFPWTSKIESQCHSHSHIQAHMQSLSDCHCNSFRLRTATANCHMSSGSQSPGSQSRASLYCPQLWNLWRPIWRLWEQGPSFKHWRYGSLSVPSSSVTFKAESRRGLMCTPSGLVFALHRRRLWRGPTPSWTGPLRGHEISSPQRTSLCAEWKLVLWGTWTWWSKAYSSSTRMRSTDGVDVSMHRKRTAKDASSTGCWIASTPSCEGGCQGPAREMTSQWLTSEHKMTGSLAAWQLLKATMEVEDDGRNMTEKIWRKMQDAWGSWWPGSGSEFLKGRQQCDSVTEERWQKMPEDPDGQAVSF